MKKAKYIKNINCPMTDEMFRKVKEVTEVREIAFSEFIRECIQEKFEREDIEVN